MKPHRHIFINTRTEARLAILDETNVSMFEKAAIGDLGVEFLEVLAPCELECTDIIELDTLIENGCPDCGDWDLRFFGWGEAPHPAIRCGGCEGVLLRV